MQKISTPEKLKALYDKLGPLRDPKRVCIVVCGGTGCGAAGCHAVRDEFIKVLKKKKLEKKVDLVFTGCHGFCERGPLVVVRPQDWFFQRVKPKDAEEIIDKAILAKEAITRLQYKIPGTKDRALKEMDVPFYGLQKRLVFALNGYIDPRSLDDYIGFGGYQALAKALKKKPEKVIEEVTRSGLRGRGGGGFSAGRKWQGFADAKGEPKYVMCNADEGDPGAFMDRSILEGNPHSVLEGMIIGSWATQANFGFVYVRQEYPLACEMMIKAIEDAREAGLLGKNILGSGHDFDVEVNMGGGAFVCGESSALMFSLEGKIGEPRQKYVRSVDSGYMQKPSLLNNVETWANVPHILQMGWKKYASIGTEKSTGTKIFSLVGKINNTGLVEVPMGITLREIVYDIGGGIPHDREFKAIQTGGPSGGCIPEKLLDLQVDFDTLRREGSMMGSGGMIVMDDRTCMVDVARYFTRFLLSESCGKCTPCREGLHQLLIVLDRICEGKGRMADLDTIERLCGTIRCASLCGLGKDAPNPVLSTLKYFRHEYEEHISGKFCRAGVCKPLTGFVITEACTGCTLCAKACPVDCIKGDRKKLHVINQKKCIACGACFDACRFDAVRIEKKGVTV